MKRLVEKEEDFFDWLIERAWKKNGPDSKDGWENWLLEHWPHKLSTKYWYYLFSGLGEGEWGHRLPWINLWSPITDTYEMKYWFKDKRFHPVFLFEETKGERLLCRMRGHPNGEIYYNPGGFEPDHRCKDCGEEIG